MSKKNLELRKIGTFYHAFDEDAIILNYLFNYKLINKKCGFPTNALPKVLNTLENEQIHYEIIGDEESKFTKGKNQYQQVLNKAKNVILINEKVSSIEEKLIHASEEKLDKILKEIEKMLDE